MVIMAFDPVDRGLDLLVEVTESSGTEYGNLAKRGVPAQCIDRCLAVRVDF